jgi:hypothetical protein
MTLHVPPAEAGSADNRKEMLIMEAIVGNCAALGIASEEAKRMAIRSVLNLRRARIAA